MLLGVDIVNVLSIVMEMLLRITDRNLNSDCPVSVSLLHERPESRCYLFAYGKYAASQLHPFGLCFLYA